MEDFAVTIGLKPETYRRYERGETEPNINTLSKIRQVTGINLNFLIAGEPDLVVNTPKQASPKVKRSV